MWLTVLHAQMSCGFRQNLEVGDIELPPHDRERKTNRQTHRETEVEVQSVSRTKEGQASDLAAWETGGKDKGTNRPEVLEYQ